MPRMKTVADADNSCDDRVRHLLDKGQIDGLDRARGTRDGYRPTGSEKWVKGIGDDPGARWISMARS